MVPPCLSCLRFKPSKTERASFDMCMFGLKHPISRRFLRKSSQVFSTDPSMVVKLQASRCDHRHMHQPIEGSVNVNGHRLPLTRFCATYSSGFVHKVARWMIQNMQHELMVGEHDEEPPAKRSRFTNNPLKRFKSSHVIDLDANTSNPSVPTSAPSMPLDSQTSGEIDNFIPSQESQMDENQQQFHVPGVQPVASGARENAQQSDPSRSPPVPNMNEAWRAIFQSLEVIAPRVGNFLVDASHAVFAQVQALVPLINLQVIFVCRGTERMQLPLNLPDRQVNTMRHTVSLHRNTGEIHDFGSEECPKSLFLLNLVFG